MKFGQFLDEPLDYFRFFILAWTKCHRIIITAMNSSFSVRRVFVVDGMKFEQFLDPAILTRTSCFQCHVSMNSARIFFQKRVQVSRSIIDPNSKKSFSKMSILNDQRNKFLFPEWVSKYTDDHAVDSNSKNSFIEFRMISSTNSSSRNVQVFKSIITRWILQS